MAFLDQLDPNSAWLGYGIGSIVGVVAGYAFKCYLSQREDERLARISTELNNKLAAQNRVLYTQMQRIEKQISGGYQPCSQPQQIPIVQYPSQDKEQG